MNTRDRSLLRDKLRSSVSNKKMMIGVLFGFIVAFLSWQILGYYFQMDNLKKIKDLKNLDLSCDECVQKDGTKKHIQFLMKKKKLHDEIDKLTNVPVPGTISLVLAILCCSSACVITIYVLSGIAKTD